MAPYRRCTMLRTDVTWLLQKELAEKYLSTCYDTMEKKVDRFLANDEFSDLTSNSWLSMNNGSVLNYIPVSLKEPLFLKQGSTGEQGHDKDYIYRNICRFTDKT